MKTKIQKLLCDRSDALNRLVEPARAAANQMRDAGMVRGAAGVEAVLFEYDATVEELKSVLQSDPIGFTQYLLEAFSKPK